MKALLAIIILALSSSTYAGNDTGLIILNGIQYRFPKKLNYMVIDGKTIMLSKLDELGDSSFLLPSFRVEERPIKAIQIGISR